MHGVRCQPTGHLRCATKITAPSKWTHYTAFDRVAAFSVDLRLVFQHQVASWWFHMLKAARIPEQIDLRIGPQQHRALLAVVAGVEAYHPLPVDGLPELRMQRIQRAEAVAKLGES